MEDSSYNAAGRTDLTSFITARYYVVGGGETMSEIEANGEWLATDDPVDVRR